jgi:hypothetical protein
MVCLRLREKDSNLHFLIQGQASYPLDDPAQKRPRQQRHVPQSCGRRIRTSIS